ncbi:pectin lyase-like protein [Serendipita vermifera]|nr:pectin lyase-like protein [Serendipita vermifera]
MLIGHSDSNESKDKKMSVTFQWKNPNSCGPYFRLGTGHVYNNYYENMNDSINTHVADQLLVENSVWGGSCGDALYSTDGGYAVARGNEFSVCSSGNTAPSGSLSSVSYSYSLTRTSKVKSVVTGGAGANLSFEIFQSLGTLF